MSTTLHLIIHGQVQGVFYRDVDAGFCSGRISNGIPAGVAVPGYLPTPIAAIQDILSVISLPGKR